MSEPTGRRFQEPDPHLVAVATALAEADLRLMYALVERRRSLGLTQAQVAERLGWSTATVARLERYDSDPRLSQVRRYALAVDAAYTHTLQVPGVVEGPTTEAGRPLA